MSNEIDIMTIPVLLENIRKKHPKDEVDRLELAMDGVFWRESDHIIAGYSRFPIGFIRNIRASVKEINNQDYFTI